MPATTMTATLWSKHLQVLIQACNNVPSRKHSRLSTQGGSKLSSIDYWLSCTYIDLQRQNKGTVHAVTALGSFAGLRLWKAYKVIFRRCLQFSVDPLVLTGVTCQFAFVSSM